MRRIARRALAGVVSACVLATAGASSGGLCDPRSPLLPFSTLLGGSSDDRANAAAFGPDGAPWIAATSFSTDFPGAPRPAGDAGGADVVVLRFDPATRSVLSAAWLGGGGHVSAAALAFDRDGNAFVAGETTGELIPGASTIGEPAPGEDHVFVARLRRDGTGFEWVTVLGGSRWEDNPRLAVTDDGDPILCGRTTSPDFPLKDALRATFRIDGSFLVRLEAGGSRLVFSTFLVLSFATAIGVAPGGGILVAGYSTYTDLPGARHLLGSATGAGAFLAEIDPEGREVRRVAGLGGTDVTAIVPVAPGAVLLAGRTTLDDVPGAHAPHGPPGEEGDGFLLRVSAADWRVEAGTLYGGAGRDYPSGAAVAPVGAVWLGGSTGLEDLPVPGAIQPFLASGTNDAFVAAFAPDDLALEYATYLGGDQRELGEGLAIAPDGGGWFAGATWSSDFHLVNALQDRASSYSRQDMFLARLLPGDAAAVPSAPAGAVAEVLGGNAVRLRWEPAPAEATGFAVFRRHASRIRRVATLPAGTMEWADDTVLPARDYAYSVQAVNAAGGSPPSAWAQAATPGTLDVTIERGSVRLRPYGYRGPPFRLRGTLVPNAAAADRAIDPLREGIEWKFGSPDYRGNVLFLAPGDPG